MRPEPANDTAAAGSLGPASRRITLRSYEFRCEREAGWAELEEILRKIERRGLRRLPPTELGRLPVLYRAAVSSLSVARAISLDRNVLEYLESLAARAYFAVYTAKGTLGRAIAAFFGVRFPAAVRRARVPIALAAACFLVGTLAAFELTSRDPERFYAFISSEVAQGRGPTSTTEELREVLYDTGGGASDVLAAFATFLFTHNAKIGILAFALGFSIVPVFLLLLVNGLGVGAIAGLYHERGLGLEFWAWILPHGVTELGAVFICGGAGLVIAGALLFPGRHGRLENLRQRGRDAGVLAIGAVAMFFAAAGIEGVFRQLVHDVGVRYAVAVVTAAAWLVYFGRAGRTRGSEET